MYKFEVMLYTTSGLIFGIILTCVFWIVAGGSIGIPYTHLQDMLGCVIYPIKAVAWGGTVCIFGAFALDIVRDKTCRVCGK